MVREDRPMSFFEHLEELRHRLVRAFIAFVISFVVVLVIHIDWITVGGVQVPFPVLSLAQPMAAQLLNWMIAFLTPEGVTITVLEAQEFFVQELRVGTFLAVAISMPVIVYELAGFVAPALHANERRLILWIAAPSGGLFVLGVLFAFFLILPFTFTFLYSLVPGNITRQLRVESFLFLVVPFLVAFGLAFELPMIMVALSSLGVVKYTFWRQHWRIAILAAFVFGAIITPDGTGITMVLVALPMTGLYAAGYVGSWAVGRNRRTKP